MERAARLTGGTSPESLAEKVVYMSTNSANLVWAGLFPVWDVSGPRGGFATAHHRGYATGHQTHMAVMQMVNHHFCVTSLVTYLVSRGWGGGCDRPGDLGIRVRGSKPLRR